MRSLATDVAALELAHLAVGTDSPRRFNSVRGFLHDEAPALALVDLLRERPEDFGAIGAVTLGADTVRLTGDRGRFAEFLWLDGVEIIDGYQRLRTIALVLDELGPDHVSRALLRVEVVCGAERERARRLHDRADVYLSIRTAQDRLVRSPNVDRLVKADWERGAFEPRRGVATGPRGEQWSMAEVTRALACVSGPSPEIAHLASTAEGLAQLWGEIESPAHRRLFHARMTPVGVMRAVEVWRAARTALHAVPKNRQRGHGLLIKYAPDIICWASCRFLPREELHDPKLRFDWEVVEREINDSVGVTAQRLVERYEELAPEERQYHRGAVELALWEDLAMRG
ncbi:hypothetical protein [Kitasatospora sp. MBT66]|uniref:hypothetical protein n=1 Tax=Kitasatospora sp. MBT66 TaxID=1444769 RepID=UPI0005BCD7A5|nr:hypothetical protein [Kitasatospora sp. MBT66]